MIIQANGFYMYMTRKIHRSYQQIIHFAKIYHLVFSVKLPIYNAPFYY